MKIATVLLLFTLISVVSPSKSGQSSSSRSRRSDKDVEYSFARGLTNRKYMSKIKKKRAKSSKRMNKLHKKSKSSSKQSKPAQSCTTLESNTAQALETAIVEANGEPLYLCATEIVFEKELALDVPVHLSCQDTCVFDGDHARRLFSFGSVYFPDEYPIDYNVFFQHVTFQNGLGAPLLDRPGGQRGGGGGAIQFVGYKTSTARFEDCIFQDNNGTYAYNGGAIDVWTGGPMKIVRTAFVRNTAHTGGAISATDISITLKDSSFVNNTVCGGAEGAAIYLGSSEFPAPDNVVVECLDGNVFEGNLDGICLDDPSYEFEYDIVGPSKNCHDIATP